MNVELSKIDNLVVEGIDFNDHPDYTDAFILSADYDGKAMTSEELEELNEDSEKVYELVFQYLH
jgi:hypothetical protein